MREKSQNKVRTQTLGHPVVRNTYSGGKVGGKVRKENEVLKMFQYLDYYFGWYAVVKLLDESRNLFWGEVGYACA